MSTCHTWLQIPWQEHLRDAAHRDTVIKKRKIRGRTSYVPNSICGPGDQWESEGFSADLCFGCVHACQFLLHVPQVDQMLQPTTTAVNADRHKQESTEFGAWRQNDFLMWAEKSIFPSELEQIRQNGLAMDNMTWQVVLECQSLLLHCSAN